MKKKIIFSSIALVLQIVQYFKNKTKSFNKNQLIKILNELH